MTFPKLLFINSSEELLRLSQNLEHQAAENYYGLAKTMRQHQNTDVADLFEWLAKEEESHETRLKELASKTSATESDAQLWEYPIELVFDKKIEDPFLFDRYDALCFALYNEQRSCDLFIQIASQASNDSLRELAEKLAKEEIGHISALRLARLKVSQQLKETKPVLAWWKKTDQIRTLDDFKKCLVEINLGSLFEYQKTLAALDHQKDKAAKDIIAGIVGDLLISLDKETEQLPSISEEKETPAAALINALKYTNLTIDYIALIAEQTQEDSIFQKAHRVNEQLTDRLNRIRQCLGAYIQA